MAKAIEEFSDLGIMDIPDLIDGAKKRGVFVFDLETTGLNFRRDRIDGIAFYLPPLNNLPAERVWYPFVKNTMVVVKVSCSDCDWNSYRISATNACPACGAVFEGEDEDTRAIKQDWVSIRSPMEQEEIMEELRPLFLMEELILSRIKLN